MTITRRVLAALLPFSVLAPWLKSPGNDQQLPIGDPGEHAAHLAFHNGPPNAPTDVTEMYVQVGCLVIRHEDVVNHTVSYRYLDIKDQSAPWRALPHSAYVERATPLKLEYDDGDPRT